MNDGEKKTKKRKGKGKNVDSQQMPTGNKGGNGTQFTTQNDGDVKSVRVMSAVFYIIVFMIGLPIWYRTTTPLRHSLPDISSLLVHSQMITNKIPVTVVSVDNLERDELRQQLVGNWPRKVNSDGSATFDYEWRVRRMVAQEEEVFKKHKTLTEIDATLNLMESHRLKGRIVIYLVPDRLVTQAGIKSFVLGSGRSIYLSDTDTDTSALSEAIIEVLDLVLEPHKAGLVDSVSAPSKPGTTNAIKFLVGNQMDVIINFVAEDLDDAIEFQKSNKINKVHQLTDGALVAESGVSELINMKITSQMVYYALPNDFISSNLANNTGSDIRLYNTANVPQLFNTIESRIVEHNGQEIAKFIVLLPSSKGGSLKFYNPANREDSNIMMTMHKDGVVVWNDENDFNVGFKTYIRSLIGLPHRQHPNALRRNIFFAQWELDAIVRQVSLLQLSKSLTSLESIQKLLLKVSNIVILEEIAQRMHSAVDSSHTSIDNLAAGELANAYSFSSKAYQASETAFFDPSLLALLYFPQDQKYAIYFPLFLPLSLPLLTSLFVLIRSCFSKSEKVNAKKNN